jgi:hypothetical protein
MSAPIPAGGMSVMASRREPSDSLDFFPTPPWATRALCEHVLIPQELASLTCWEPACGEGHMAAVLAEYFLSVRSTDVHDYGYPDQAATASFVGPGVYIHEAVEIDWIITNPPFNLALEFAERAIREAKRGTALLTRTSWLEGGKRHERLFGKNPPSCVALFAERVPMVKGRWDPKASTATSYAWVIWRPWHRGQTELRWIPPGRRAALTKPYDVARFAGTKA